MPLFSRHTNNSNTMFQKIYDTYWNRMFAMVSRKVKDRDDVFDVMQNIFFHLWIYRESLSDENIESVIIKTCVQEISNYFSQQKKQPFTTEVENVQLADDSNERLQAILEEEVQLDHLWNNMELLPTTRKKILTMNKIEGITQEKIAVTLNLSTKAVKKQISKAIAFLRQSQENP